MLHCSACWIRLSLLLFCCALVSVAQQYGGTDISVNGRLVPAPQIFRRFDVDMQQWNASWSPSEWVRADQRLAVLENELAWTERAYIIMTDEEPRWWVFVRWITSPRLTKTQKEYWNSVNKSVRNSIMNYVFQGHQAKVAALMNFDFGSSPNFNRFTTNFIPPVQGDEFAGGMMNIGIQNPFRRYVTEPIKERIKQEHGDWDRIDREMKLIERPTPASSPAKGQDGKKDTKAK